MPKAIDAQIRGNIFNEWKIGIDSKDYDSIRELSVSLKSEGMAFNDLASIVRLNNYIKKLGADFDQIESFISNIAKSEDQQMIIGAANQIAQLSESIPLHKIPDHIKQQQDKLQTLQQEKQAQF
jgi:hypothetical protein